MLKSREFQPHTLRLNVNVFSYVCPICGKERRYSTIYLPENCEFCGASFEWKVTVHYREEEEKEEV